MAWSTLGMWWRDPVVGRTSCPASPGKHLYMCLLLQFRVCGVLRPVNTETELQLTHCWLGMATEVSTSAMAPNIWSVRPWFFCRAFILPQWKIQTFLKWFPFVVVTCDLQLSLGLFLFLSLAVCPLFLLSACFLLLQLLPHGALCHSLELSHRKPAFFYPDTQETSCRWIIDPGRGENVSVWIWKRALGQESQRSFRFPFPSLLLQLRHRWPGGVEMSLPVV